MAANDLFSSSMPANQALTILSEAAGTREGTSRREQLAMSFVTVWTKHARSARLALPLLRTANVLYNDCSMHSLPRGHGFPGQHSFLCLWAALIQGICAASLMLS